MDAAAASAAAGAASAAVEPPTKQQRCKKAVDPAKQAEIAARIAASKARRAAAKVKAAAAPSPQMTDMEIEAAIGAAAKTAPPQVTNSRAAQYCRTNGTYHGTLLPRDVFEATLGLNPSVGAPIVILDAEFARILASNLDGISDEALALLQRTSQKGRRDIVRTVRELGLVIFLVSKVSFKRRDTGKMQSANVAYFVGTVKITVPLAEAFTSRVGFIASTYADSGMPAATHEALAALGDRLGEIRDGRGPQRMYKSPFQDKTVAEYMGYLQDWLQRLTTARDAILRFYRAVLGNAPTQAMLAPFLELAAVPAEHLRLGARKEDEDDRTFTNRVADRVQTVFNKVKACNLCWHLYSNGLADDTPAELRTELLSIASANTAAYQSGMATMLAAGAGAGAGGAAGGASDGKGDDGDDEPMAGVADGAGAGAGAAAAAAAAPPAASATDADTEEPTACPPLIRDLWEMLRGTPVVGSKSRKAVPSKVVVKSADADCAAMNNLFALHGLAPLRFSTNDKTRVIVFDIDPAFLLFFRNVARSGKLGDMFNVVADTPFAAKLAAMMGVDCEALTRTAHDALSDAAMTAIVALAMLHVQNLGWQRLRAMAMVA